MIRLVPYYLTFALALAGAYSLHAQSPDTTHGTLSVSAYADGYFAVYTGQLGPRELQPFATASPRDNTLGINVAQVGLHYTSDRVRSEVILHYGDIPEATWDEQFRPVQTAYAGLRLRENLWLDVGFFATHIGGEGFLPKDNMLSQTAVLTYNEPFYQAGAKLTYTPTPDWEVELWGLNGYNLFLDDNDAKSLGVNVSYGGVEDWSLSYGNVFGREGPDDAPTRPFRLYQYVSADFDRGGRWRWFSSLDQGLQTDTRDGGTATAYVWVGQTTLRYRLTGHYAVTARAEFYDDPVGFISGTFPRGMGEEEGLRWVALTLGAEWAPTEDSYLRLEGRAGRAQEGLAVFGGDDFRVAGMVTLGCSVEGMVGQF